MSPGTQVLAPMRIVPIAYTPGVVTKPDPTRPHLVHVEMPHKGRWLSQLFRPDQLIVIDKNNQSPLLNRQSMI